MTPEEIEAFEWFDTQLDTALERIRITKALLAKNSLYNSDHPYSYTATVSFICDGKEITRKGYGTSYLYAIQALKFNIENPHFADNLVWAPGIKEVVEGRLKREQNL